jgi:hypothetical protein
MLKKLGITTIALAGLLGFAAPRKADAKVHVGIAVGPPVYTYPYAYGPYYNYPYYESPYYYGGPSYFYGYGHGGWGHEHHEFHGGHEWHGGGHHH